MSHWFGNQSFFIVAALLTIPTVLAIRAIKSKDIDYGLARGGASEVDGKESSAPVSVIAAFAKWKRKVQTNTLTHNTESLLAIQVLDGVANAIFVVVSILVVADRTRGTGRFNLAQGSLATAVGIGAALNCNVLHPLQRWSIALARVATATEVKWHARLSKHAFQVSIFQRF